MEPLALYIHWPFCVSKCPYCDFNSHVRERVNHVIWKDALLLELQTASLTLKRPLTSIFFGGGTPSLMHPETVHALIETARVLFGFSPHIEITLETNPNSFETQRFFDFKKAGVNRLSIGIQSFEPEALKFLGRAHSLEEAYHALESAQKIFDRVSFDLIYARPHQTLKQWEKELNHALEFSPSHLSLYQLTFEEGTVFEKKLKRGEIKALNENLSSLLYEKTQEIMDHHLLPSYEVSNHAQKGQESRHNLCYWRYQDYIGIGPGAHGRITQDHAGKQEKYATQNLKLPEKWLASVQKEGHGLETKLLLEKEIVFEEALLMGIRLKEGISLEMLKNLSENHLTSLLARPSLKTLEQEGFIEKTSTHLKATSQARPILNAVLAYMM
ncbi:MAG: hypothetical protein B7Y25_07115 [Alphaproteobacteria bacterium 16-39-46]|nr:MAG: hypothetical protein B7Y25_07115 [Alphaproteobacteria bacterium 16-39-46]OZA41867.1 MAG: hypothetical protein B7X84_07270 [Alphaproteobacteria bacterium 17-39-52]HQS84669.1 radical SAM family heme chaperone HemW [Alphaproteobacteria bacterium]HQS94495.1 radical SAM family heme chaperone HemW [Alphaproteobacteria bacterium]